MSSKRRRVSDRAGLSNMPSYYDEELEDIELDHDPRTKPAEPDLSPIMEESRPGSASTPSMSNQAWPPTVGEEEVSSDGESSTDAQSSSAQEKRLPDTAYPAPPRKAPVKHCRSLNTDYL